MSLLKTATLTSFLFVLSNSIAQESPPLAKAAVSTVLEGIFLTKAPLSKTQTLPKKLSGVGICKPFPICRTYAVKTENS